MKALSLWQPWASAIALGSKTIETRNWSTDYRGPLAIHAAKHWDRSIAEAVTEDEFVGALWALWPDVLGPARARSILPFGSIVAVCDLVDVRATESFGPEIDVEHGCRYRWTERQMGDFHPGRFGWLLANVRALTRPVPYRGERGLFDVPDALASHRTPEAEAFTHE